MGIEILATSWKSSGGSYIGFVLAKNEVGQVSCRVGSPPFADRAGTVEQDVDYIVSMGAKMERSEAIALFPQQVDEILNNWKE